MGTSSTFVELLAAETTSKMGARCSIAAFAESDHEYRDAILAAIDDPDVQATAVARACKTVGFNVGADTVRRHRKLDCKCPPAEATV